MSVTVAIYWLELSYHTVINQSRLIFTTVDPDLYGISWIVTETLSRGCYPSIYLSYLRLTLLPVCVMNNAHNSRLTPSQQNKTPSRQNTATTKPIQTKRRKAHDKKNTTLAHWLCHRTRSANCKRVQHWSNIDHLMTPWSQHQPGNGTEIITSEMGLSYSWYNWSAKDKYLFICGRYTLNMFMIRHKTKNSGSS